MAVRGLTKVERQEYILKRDPAHPDNIFRAKQAWEKSRKDSGENVAGSDDFKPEGGDATKFYIGTVDADIRAMIADMISGFVQDGITGDMRMMNKVSIRNLMWVKFGLRGVDNFTDDNGVPIQFDTEQFIYANRMMQVASAPFLAAIDEDDIRELAEAIRALNSVDDVLRKKLSGVSGR